MSDAPNSPLPEEATAHYKALLRSVFDGRRFLLTGNAAAWLGYLARRLRGLGAARPFLIAGGLEAARNVRP